MLTEVQTAVTEKRKFKRISRKFVLQVAANGYSADSKDWTLVTSQNLGAGGVLFTFDRALEKGTPLAFTIHFPDDVVNCRGRVLRSSPAGKKPFVHIAATLEGLSEREVEFLENSPA